MTTLPVLELTWQHNVNQLIPVSSGKLEAETLMLAIKTSLCGFAQNPWVVVDSCNSVAAPAGTDTWLAPANLEWDSAGQTRSWIVLQNASGAQILIDLLSSYNSDYTLFALYFSPSVGFTGGSTTAAPTAADQVTVRSGLPWGDLQYGGAQNRLHVMMSADGAETRIVICRAGVPVATVLIGEATPQPGITWSFPYFAYWIGALNNTNVATLSNFKDYPMAASYESGAFAMYMSLESWGSYNSAVYPTSFVGVVDSSGGWPIAPIAGLWSGTSGKSGKWGTPSGAGASAIRDVYFVSSTPGQGAGFLNPEGDRVWALFGNVLLPWDGSVVATV